jgi:hypothetical protein
MIATRKREVFTPPNEVLYARGEMLRWMIEMEWAESVRDEILYRDNPPPDVVRYLVWRHGPVKAYRILEVMQA